MTTEKVINDNTYRIKKMNAIETLAIQGQFSFDNAEQTEMFYKQVLERVEVKCNDKWLSVKEKDKDIYYPLSVENDLYTIQQIIAFFMNWLKEVFQKSNESNSQTE